MNDQSKRIVLNPKTTELEILMGEMIKKKLHAKEKVLRELENQLHYNRDADNEMQCFKNEYMSLSTENAALEGQLDMLKTNYLKMKEHLKIDSSSLKS